MVGVRSPDVDYDVVIVGAGPSGLSTALHLVRLDPTLARRCLVLEAKAHPRDKACAGGLTRGALCYLRRLGADLGSLPRLPITRVLVRLGEREVTIHGEPCFEVARRSVHDALLATLIPETGPVLCENVRARSVRVESDRVEIVTDRGSLWCRAAVGADGASGVVRRSLWPADGTHPIVGLQRRVPETGRTACEATFDFTPLRAGILGYTWDFPTLDAARGVGIFARGDIREVTEYFEDSLGASRDAAGVRAPLQAVRVRAFRPSDTPSRPRVFLVGDAVGVDPLFGEGISLALGYGELAAKALAEAFAGAGFGFSGYRRELLAHPVGRCLVRRYRRSRLLGISASRALLGPLWDIAVEMGRRSFELEVTDAAR